MSYKTLFLALACAALLAGCKSSSDTASTSPTATTGSTADTTAPPASDSSTTTDSTKVASTNDFTGTWDATLADSHGTNTYVVTPETITITDVKKDGNGKALTMTSVQKYKLDGNKVSSEIQTISFVSEDPDTDKEFKAGQPKIDASIKSGKMNYTGTLDFKDKDHATLNTVDGDGTKQNVTLTRKA